MFVTKIDLVQTSNFSGAAESNANELKQRIFLICTKARLHDATKTSCDVR